MLALQSGRCLRGPVAIRVQLLQALSVSGGLGYESRKSLGAGPRPLARAAGLPGCLPGRSQKGQGFRAREGCPSVGAVWVSLAAAGLRVSGDVLVSSPQSGPIRPLATAPEGDDPLGWWHSGDIRVGLLVPKAAGRLVETVELDSGSPLSRVGSPRF
jgi:hypothetical protein